MGAAAPPAQQAPAARCASCPRLPYRATTAACGLSCLMAAACALRLSPLPQLRGTCKACFASTVALSMLLVLAMFLFLGSGWAPDKYYGNIRLAVLDLDGGAVGVALRAAASHSPFTVVAVANSTSYAGLVHEVDRGDFHAALVAQPGASAALRAALAAGATSPYDASAAVTLVFDEGRGGAALAAMLRASSAALVLAASAAVERRVLNTSVAPAIGLSTQLLHPVPHAGIALSAGIAYILCWITMLTVTMICLKLYGAWEAAGVRLDHAVWGRLAHQVACALALSFWPPVVLECLGAGLTGRVFFAFWAFAWLSMTAFGCMITALMRELGPELGGLVHLLFLISNLVSSGSISPVDLTPPYYRVGYALPFYNAVAGTRTILFGSHDQLGRNVGILFAWIGLVLLRASMRALATRRQLRAAQAAA